MTSLEWKDLPAARSSQSKKSAGPDIWFAITMGLLGFITGYIIAQFIR